MYTVYTGINPVLVAVHPRLAGAAACLRGAAAAPAGMGCTAAAGAAAFRVVVNWQRRWGGGGSG